MPVSILICMRSLLPVTQSVNVGPVDTVCLSGHEGRRVCTKSEGCREQFHESDNWLHELWLAAPAVSCVSHLDSL